MKFGKFCVEFLNTNLNYLIYDPGNQTFYKHCIFSIRMLNNSTALGVSLGYPELDTLRVFENGDPEGV
jgi:hypothetical protein